MDFSNENLTLSNKLQFFLKDKEINIEMDKLINIKNLGEGNFSNVQLMKDPLTNNEFAVKMIHNIADQVIKDIVNDIEIGKSITSEYKIEYYGGLKDKFNIWILMEPMDLSVRSFYKKISNSDNNYRFPGIILGYFSYCSVQVLEDLHVEKVIHRDVKPSNMLINKFGLFKICDFGISGKLKDSLVQSAVGTNAYLAPERINPETHNQKYSIISDVWSLGLSIMELAEMRFPFSNSKSLMAQLNDIVCKPPPALSSNSPYHKEYPELNEFFKCTLVKEPQNRYNYVRLKPLPLLQRFSNREYLNEAQKTLSELVLKHI